MSDCPSENTVLDWVEGRLDEQARNSLSGHVDQCAACRALIASVAADSKPAYLKTGARLDRYVILEVVGSGAMGIVYAAYDPDLSRKVALKLLRADVQTHEPTDALRTRMLREARAMAQLSHPNVIAIHDVGTFEGEVFLAMEFVEGENLRTWLREPRPWREVLRTFVDAGRGLQAAHAAGLVHRDFKPANVLLSSDGRVRVTDFGLARSTSEAEATSALSAPLDSGAAQATQTRQTLTRTGALIGTPAYMAPEQLTGAPADARTDLYSYCVALWEALTGERPQARVGVAPSSSSPAARSRRVPAWLLRVVRQGLAARPEDRPASMQALLDALERGPLVTVQRVAIAGALVALIAGGAVVTQRHAQPQCAEPEWTWTSDGHAAASAAFTASGRPAAAGTFSAVETALDGYRRAWTGARREACEATWVQGAQSQALLDLRMQCLDDRRRAVDAVQALFAKADAQVVDRAAQVVAGLPPLAECANARALQTTQPLPADPAVRARLDELSRTYEKAVALGDAYKHEEALQTIAPALEATRAIGYRPLEAKLLLLRGRVIGNTPRREEAAAALQEAALMAELAHDDASAADAWTLLAHQLQRVRRRDEAALWLRYAQTAIDRLGGDDLREAARLQAMAIPLWEDEKLSEARELAERGLALAKKASGPESFRVGQLEEILGGIALDAGDAAGALPHHRASRTIREKLFGPQHRLVAVAMLNEATDLLFQGGPDDALPLMRRALALYDQDPIDGDDNWPHNRIALALRWKGDFAGALEEDRAALATLERVHHMDEPSAGEAWCSEAEDLLALNRVAEARESIDKALALKAKLKIDDFDTWIAQYVLAQVQRAQGETAKADALQREVDPKLDAYVKKYGGWYGAFVQRLRTQLARK